MKDTFSFLKSHKKRLLIKFIVSFIFATLVTLSIPAPIQFPLEACILGISVIAIILTCLLETASFALKKFLTFRKNFAKPIPIRSFILLVAGFLALYLYQICILSVPFYYSLLTSTLALAIIRMITYFRYRRHPPRQS